MIPYIQYGLGIRNNQVVLRYVNKSGGREIHRTIKSGKDFATFIMKRIKIAKCEPHDLIIMCSSSMDFPEDSTSNKRTIALARELR